MRHVGRAKDRKLLTVFAYPEDDGDFGQAQRRCVGVGKCLQSSGGVMCPQPPGDQGGAALDPGSRPSAKGDAARRGGHRRLAALRS